MSLNIMISDLKTSLNFLHVSELKELCAKLLLSEKGKKGELIHRIITFIETGEKQVSPKFPKISCAKTGQTYELSKDGLMLRGAYKNDLKTRLFLKKLIGEHFHFTAFGIDWLNERWMNGNPPTYQEFASMWQEEYAFRRKNGSIPKDEWAYINFVKNYLAKNPKVSSSEILNQWKIERNKHKDIVDKFFADASDNTESFNITPELAQKLIAEQFSEYIHLTITSVEMQGHDNRTFRLGDEMLIRMPSADQYALKVAKEQDLLPRLERHLSFDIPAPIKMGHPSQDYPYPFSIYKWLEGRSLNLINKETIDLEKLAFDMAKFLKELQAIKDVAGPMPGQHNWWRGSHISVYDKDAREQIAKLAGIIDSPKAMNLWTQALKIKWNKPPVWIHGDFAIGNMLMKDGKLSAIIDFGGMGMGDPACDLVIAWVYLTGKSREIFIEEMNLDEDTWFRAKAWALWKSSFVLCELDNKNSIEGIEQRRIIGEILK